MPNIRPYKLHHDDLGFLVCRNCGRRIEIEEAGLRHVGNGQRLCSSVGEKANRCTSVMQCASSYLRYQGVS